MDCDRTLLKVLANWPDERYKSAREELYAFAGILPFIRENSDFARHRASAERQDKDERVTT